MSQDITLIIEATPQNQMSRGISLLEATRQEQSTYQYARRMFNWFNERMVVRTVDPWCHYLALQMVEQSILDTISSTDEQSWVELDQIFQACGDLLPSAYSYVIQRLVALSRPPPLPMVFISTDNLLNENQGKQPVA